MMNYKQIQNEKLPESHLFILQAYFALQNGKGERGDSSRMAKAKKLFFRVLIYVL